MKYEIFKTHPALICSSIMKPLKASSNTNNICFGGHPVQCNNFRPVKNDEYVDREESISSNNRIKIKEILKITGTFDGEQFKRKFDEDSLKIKNLREELESPDEGIDVTSIYDVERPVTENSVKKILDSRTKTERPISFWFLRELLNMANEQCKYFPVFKFD